MKTSKQNETKNPHGLKEGHDEDTSERVRRHITDPHDEISEEDIRNVVPGTGNTSPDEEGATELKELGKEREKQAESRDKPSEGRITPWDVIE